MSYHNWADRRIPTNRNATLAERLKYILAKFVQGICNLVKVATFINLLLFFITHSKRSLTERLLGIDLHRVDPNQRRHIDFTYINRLIVWNAVGQALSSLLPFLDMSRFKSMFQMTNKLTQYITLDQGDINSDNWCGVCGATQLCMPYRSKQCGHTFCYYCVRSEMLKHEDDDTMWKCVKCGIDVKEIEPLIIR